MRTPQDLEPDDEVFVQRLCQGEPEINIAYQLAQEFKDIVRHRCACDLPNWLARAEASGVRELRGFVAGIGRDYQAVRAALQSVYSNGPVEGYINRLKTIKRSIYGRAHHDLLRLRVLAT